ncbi:MAG: metalloregulator ArsR/SmtB family transcription factor [Thermodesulfobacteriota bacterium]
MKKQAHFFKGLADETRLKILWLLMGHDELCVCDIMGVLGTTQSKASRHLRYLFNLGLVDDRREGLWMYYRLAVAPGSREEKQLKLLGEMLAGRPEAQALRRRLEKWLATKQCQVRRPERAEVELPA